jgi:hypothetical protein
MRELLVAQPRAAQRHDGWRPRRVRERAPQAKDEGRERGERKQAIVGTVEARGLRQAAQPWWHDNPRHVCVCALNALEKRHAQLDDLWPPPAIVCTSLRTFRDISRFALVDGFNGHELIVLRLDIRGALVGCELGDRLRLLLIRLIQDFK